MCFDSSTRSTWPRCSCRSSGGRTFSNDSSTERRAPSRRRKLDHGARPQRSGQQPARPRPRRRSRSSASTGYPRGSRPPRPPPRTTNGPRRSRQAMLGRPRYRAVRRTSRIALYGLFRTTRNSTGVVSSRARDLARTTPREPPPRRRATARAYGATAITSRPGSLTAPGSLGTGAPPGLLAMILRPISSMVITDPQSSLYSCRRRYVEARDMSPRAA
jgi:hypothetical protein